MGEDVLVHAQCSNLDRAGHHLLGLPVWRDINTTFHQIFSFTYSACHCFPSLPPSHFPFIIIRWQKLCRLSSSHWLFDIEGGKRSGVPSRPYTSSHCFAWRPGDGVVGNGGCASVSAPALYPFLSITVQVKQMIGFSQWGD